jgi:glycosyltransferase involved in cell wall biosynthesis
MFFPLRTIKDRISLRRKRNIPNDAIVLVFVGSVIERKGVDVLIRAFIDAASRCANLFLLIVGPKSRRENPSLDETFVSSLVQTLKESNLVDRVSFTGLIQDRYELAKIYRASDIFVFPSKNEGMPNVLLEAMASGLPVIVSQLPVLEKVVTHYENGVVVPVSSVENWRDAIITLVTQPNLAQVLGQNANHYIEARHGFSAWETQLTDFYQSLLS